MNFVQFLILFFFIKFSSNTNNNNNILCDPVPGTPPNDPIGENIGNYPKPGRVVWSHNPKCCSWTGSNSTFYWSPDNLDQRIVDDMLEETITRLTGSDSVKDSWDLIVSSFNERRYGEKDRKYKPGEKIAIKINLNGECMKYENNNFNQVSPQFLKALLSQLVNIVGVRQEDISIYDASRLMEPFFVLEPQGIGKDFPNVKLVDNNGGMDYATKVVPDMKSYLDFSDDRVSDKNGTKLPKIVTEARYLIEIADFRGHTMAGVTLSGKNWFGSIYRPDANCEFGLIKENPHWCPMTLHEWVYVDKIPMGTYSPFVDFLGHPDMGKKVMIFLSDGLYGGPSEDDDMIGIPPIKFLSQPFGNHWSSSIFASLDPISLDSVLYDILRNEPNVPYASHGCIDNYLHEAAKADNPVSGTVYKPDGKTVLKSLGIHEHWNNEKDRMYSKNLGKDYGIELEQLLH